MKPAFEDRELWEKFKKEVLSWTGTPYRHLQHTKGRGADCTLFLADVLVKVGILKKVSFPIYYSKDWFLHTKEDVIMDQFHKNFSSNTTEGFVWERIDEEHPKELVQGDILLFRVRPSIAVIHHSSVYIGKGMMFHGSRKRVFQLEKYYGKWENLCAGMYRLMMESNNE